MQNRARLPRRVLEWTVLTEDCRAVWIDVARLNRVERRALAQLVRLLTRDNVRELSAEPRALLGVQLTCAVVARQDAAQPLAPARACARLRVA